MSLRLKERTARGLREATSFPIGHRQYFERIYYAVGLGLDYVKIVNIKIRPAGVP